jgi:pimeloyl-ACP methyl ester carboxylesterase
MSELPPCGQPCGLSCAAVEAVDPDCPGHARLLLNETLARFWREAERGVVRAARYRMSYHSWGKGPPLVFIHGVADSRWSFLLPMARLSAHFRCVAYDLPAGRDGARLWGYRHEYLVEDLWELLDGLGVGRAYVLGSSFGSTVALEAMRARPQRLPRGVLQGGLAYRPLRRAERWLSWLARLLPGPAARIPRRKKILEMVHKEPFARQPEEVWRAFVAWTGEGRLSTLGHQARWLHRLDLRQRLPAVGQPVLLVYGDRDPAMRHAEVLQAGLPAAGLAVLEGCGHQPSYTHPEAFAEVVRQFLTPPGGAAGGACGGQAGRHSLPCQG